MHANNMECTIYMPIIWTMCMRCPPHQHAFGRSPSDSVKSFVVGREEFTTETDVSQSNPVSPLQRRISASKVLHALRRKSTNRNSPADPRGVFDEKPKTAAIEPRGRVTVASHKCLASVSPFFWRSENQRFSELRKHNLKRAGDAESATEQKLF